ncbi:FecR family protein [Corticibacter populi]|nr:FecR domain-containing protein [Corticibacter populi]RZS33544.1 FecR family protein [Corticibacter populi]
MPVPHDDDAALRRQELVRWFLRRQEPQGWTAQDEQAFEGWLAAHAGNQALYARWEADWRLMDALPDAAIDRLRAQVAADRVAAGSAAPAMAAAPRRAFMHRGLALAGVAGVAVTAGSLGWLHGRPPSSDRLSLRTGRGEMRELTLPDGSQLMLDTATELQVRYHADARELRLHQGQAVFSVVPDAQRPFRVVAGSVRVTVTGTRFSVRHTPDQAGRAAPEVAVASGEVRVEGGRLDLLGRWQAEEALPAHALTAGQQLVWDGQAGAPSLASIRPDQFANWRERRVSFSDTPLAQAVAELERYADTGITSMDPRAAQLRLSGTFRSGDAQAMRRLLAGALPIRLEPDGEGYRIRAAVP